MAKKVICAADLFCGAGGTSTGMAQAAAELGAKLQLLAVNHWDIAIRTHSRNHPDARHLCTGLESVDPTAVVPGGKLDILWASPSCTHHSVARGGKPMCDQTRAQPWMVLHWLENLNIKRFVMENVPEIVTWGPLGVNMKPLKSKKGALFREFLKHLEILGYRYEWRILNCADYGDVTTRRRFFLQAVKGKGNIRWPEPSHAQPDESGKVPKGRMPWIPARDIIDWSYPGVSIFNRTKPLAKNTLKRIRAGIERFWGEWAEPFLVIMNGTSDNVISRTARTVEIPLPTVTTSGHVGLVSPFLADDIGSAAGFLVPNFGENGPQAPRTHSLDDPLPTATSHGAGCLVQPDITPFVLPQHSAGRPRTLSEPLSTITTAGASSICSAFLTLMNNWPSQQAGRSLDEPLPTQTTTNHVALTEPILVSFYGTGSARPVSEPVATLTCKDRHGLVVGTCGLDILFRMLQPHELAAAHSMQDYKFEGNKGEITKQVGNSVPVKTAKAINLAVLSA